MKANEKDIELIERYIDGELKGDDLEVFEKRLKEEPELVKEYNARNKIAEVWKDTTEYETTRNEISAALQAGRSSFFQRNKVYIISIAASMAMLFGIYIMFFHHNNSLNDGQQLVVSDTVNNKDKAIYLSMEEPERLASVEVLGNTIKLLSPEDHTIYPHSHKIVFKWVSSSENVDTLYIYNTATRGLALKQAIRHEEDTMVYIVEKLPEGTYIWYLNDTLKINTFTISKSN